MGNQSKKICKHDEPGKKWEQGCCSPNPAVHNTSRKSDERVIESASEAFFTAQTEAQKHSDDVAALCGGVLLAIDSKSG